MKTPRPVKQEPEFVTFPHCDTSVLHAPGVCQFCDGHPDWQIYRMNARINFTGDDNPDLSPCPSTWYRTAEQVDSWYGNRAQPE